MCPMSAKEKSEFLFIVNIPVTPAKAALKSNCCRASNFIKRSTVFFSICLNYVINLKNELVQLNTAFETPCFDFSLEENYIVISIFFYVWLLKQIDIKVT